MLKSNYVRLAFFTFVMLECYIIYAIFFSFDGIFILSLQSINNRLEVTLKFRPVSITNALRSSLSLPTCHSPGLCHPRSKSEQITEGQLALRCTEPPTSGAVRSHPCLEHICNRGQVHRAGGMCGMTADLPIQDQIDPGYEGKTPPTLIVETSNA